MLKASYDPFEIIFEMMKEQIIPDTNTYNILLQISIDRKNIDQATEILEKMSKQYQIPIDNHHLQIFFKGLQSFDNENLINQLELRKILKRIFKITKNNSNQLSILIEQSIKLSFIDLGLRFYDKNPDLNNVQIQISLIKGIKTPNIEKIEKFYRRIYQIYQNLVKTGDLQPSETILNSLIDMSLKAGDAQMAQILFESFKEHSIKPTGTTYGILVKGYGNLQNYKQVLELYTIIQQQNIEINEITLGCLVDSCIKCNQIEFAEQIIQKEKVVKANTIIYTTILKGYTKQKNLKKALDIFKLMKENPEIKPNTITYNSMIECAIQAQNYEKLNEFFQECVCNKDPDQEADLKTYSTYIKGLIKFKKINEALKVYNQVRSLKMYKLDEVLYNSILDKLLEVGEYGLALDMFENMKEDKITPSNVTYSILIKLYSTTGNFDKSIKVLDEMKEKKIQPGLIVYTCLIKSCIKVKNVKKILELYKEMKKNQVLADAVLYNTIISGLVYNKGCKEALEICLDAFRDKIVLNSEVYYNLLNNVVKIDNESIQENKQNLMNFFKNMNKYKQDIDLEVYNKIAKHMFIVSNKNSKQFTNSNQQQQQNHNENQMQRIEINRKRSQSGNQNI